MVLIFVANKVTLSGSETPGKVGKSETCINYNGHFSVTQREE